MIKLKDLLLEMSSLNLLIARRVEGRTEKYIQAKIRQYIKKWRMLNNPSLNYRPYISWYHYVIVGPMMKILVPNLIKLKFVILWV